MAARESHGPKDHFAKAEIHQARLMVGLRAVSASMAGGWDIVPHLTMIKHAAKES